MSYRTFLSQQTRDIEPMLGYCWISVADDGQLATEQWINARRSLGRGIQEYQKNGFCFQSIK